MNINSRIDWRWGLELTPETFITFDKSLDSRVKTISKILSQGVVGIIPNSIFECSPVFVKKSVEIARLRLMALLPSGQLIDIDERVEVTVPLLYGNEYYLCVGIDKEVDRCNENGVAILTPVYSYSIKTLSDIEADGELLPIVKFNAAQSSFSIDKSYIPPYIQIGGNEYFLSKITKFASTLKQIASHQNFESGEGQRAFRRYSSMVEHIKSNNRVVDFANLLTNIIDAAEYYIFGANNEHINKVTPYSLYDIDTWLSSVQANLEGAISVLDRVVLVDNTIDMEVLKAEVKAELFSEIYSSIYDKLYEEMNVTIRKNIHDDITQGMTTYINSDLKTTLKNELNVEISDTLSQSLHQTLYDKLYEALYVKPKDEEYTIPTI